MGWEEGEGLGGILKKPIYRGGLSKKGAWIVCRFKGGLGKKEEVFLRGGGVIPQCTPCLKMHFENNKSAFFYKEIQHTIISYWN